MSLFAAPFFGAVFLLQIITDKTEEMEEQAWKHE
jgi:hypothetical protein